MSEDKPCCAAAAAARLCYLNVGGHRIAIAQFNEILEKPCAAYSHGMKKKLALAAALLPGPELLFLDEPFEGVDAVSSRVLRDTLKRCVKGGATVFLTSHVLEIVEKLCTHVGIIAQGKLVHQGPMAELRIFGSLEEHFLEVVGADQLERRKLSWLEAER